MENVVSLCNGDTISIIIIILMFGRRWRHYFHDMSCCSTFRTLFIRLSFALSHLIKLIKRSNGISTGIVSAEGHTHQNELTHTFTSLRPADEVWMCEWPKQTPIATAVSSRVSTTLLTGSKIDGWQRMTRIVHHIPSSSSRSANSLRISTNLLNQGAN